LKIFPGHIGVKKILPTEKQLAVMIEKKSARLLLEIDHTSKP
jgi:hypothetical protein